MKALLLLGDQLFSPLALKSLKPALTDGVKVFMREDLSLATHFRYHKHKLVFFFAAMRDYADELREAGYEVHYEKLTDEGRDETFEDAFRSFAAKAKIAEVEIFEIQDRFFEERMERLFQDLKIKAHVSESPMFLTTRKGFQDYLKRSKKPFMQTFYMSQRKRLKILLDESGEPEGGKWSFDEENRLKLPKGEIPKALPKPKASPHLPEVIALVERLFSDHPGVAAEFWLPTDRKGARAWLQSFLDERFHHFGPYEDAIPTHSPFVYHSVLTPFLNTGLLTPSEVVRAALAHAKAHDVPLNSLEGFVRQVIGWREFIRGIYQNFGEEEEGRNFWKHTRKLSEHWWKGNTGIEPLDQMIKKCQRYSYAHHIERLMVAGNLMLLLEIDPKEAHRWFMEMFIDSADWVMGPNVYGMALFSDGGIFATKPYICGSNYYRKMGPFADGNWQDGVDGLYWGFIAKHREFFAKNPRSKMMLGTLDRMGKDRWEAIEAASMRLKEKLTREG